MCRGVGHRPYGEHVTDPGDGAHEHDEDAVEIDDESDSARSARFAIGEILRTGGAVPALKGVENLLAGIDLQRNQAVFQALRGLGASTKLNIVDLLPKTTVQVPAIPKSALSSLTRQSDTRNSLIRALILGTSTDTSRLFTQLAPGLTPITKLEIPTSVYKHLYGESFSGIAKHLARTSRLLEGINWDDFGSTWYPPNWDSGRSASQYTDFVELASSECLPLTWAPNQALTYALLEAPDAVARETLLLDNGTQILADCHEVLADLEDNQFLVESLTEALAAYSDGHHRSAHANAASVIDTALRQIFPDAKPFGFYSHVRKRLHRGNDILDTKMRAIRVVPVSVALQGMLENFHPRAGEPIPTLPNRHASAHAMHPNQYTPTNALKILMLASAVLAEMEYGGWQRALEAA